VFENKGYFIEKWEILQSGDDILKGVTGGWGDMVSS
jgi:hypothetical protein